MYLKACLSKELSEVCSHDSLQEPPQRDDVSMTSCPGSRRQHISVTLPGYHVTSCDIMWGHVTSCDITQHNVRSCEIMWDHVRSCEIMWHHETCIWLPVSEQILYYMVIEGRIRKGTRHPDTLYKRDKMREKNKNGSGDQENYVWRDNGWCVALTWVWWIFVVVEHGMQKIAEITKLWITNSPIGSQNVFTAWVEDTRLCCWNTSFIIYI